MDNYQITTWCRHFVKDHVKEGDICIDATAGNGWDSLLLSRCCGKTGRVTSFDIQPMAVARTKERLMEQAPWRNWRVVLDSHRNMDFYEEQGTVSCIMFNFGYLPGGDHSVSTNPVTSIQALSLSLELLRPGGLLSLCLYSGGDTGFQERESILSWLKTLDFRKYLVIKTDYYNRPGNPPNPVLVVKLTI
ncbi:MAG: class I SAM-dependent methyltransferase [Eubacteriales bacterium]|nr:class I SAM-dependent methyltransferase [Eubacteriales bacterium]